MPERISDLIETFKGQVAELVDFPPVIDFPPTLTNRGSGLAIVEDFLTEHRIDEEDVYVSLEAFLEKAFPEIFLPPRSAEVESGLDISKMGLPKSPGKYTARVRNSHKMYQNMRDRARHGKL